MFLRPPLRALRPFSPCLEMPGDLQDLLPYPFGRGSPFLVIPWDKGCALARLVGHAYSLGLGLLW